MLKDFLKPNWKYLDNLRKKEAEFKRKQKKDYDRRHWAHPLVSILKGSPVWLDGDIPGTVTLTTSTTRSYLVASPTGEVRRNRRRPEGIPYPVSESTPYRSPIMTRSRTGVSIAPPERLNY